jgi:hypothetical protein
MAYIVLTGFAHKSSYFLSSFLSLLFCIHIAAGPHHLVSETKLVTVKKLYTFPEIMSVFVTSQHSYQKVASDKI